MTFELSPHHVSARDEARAIAQSLAPRSGAIDQDAAVPREVARELAELSTPDWLALVLAVEQVGAANAAAACSFGARDGAPAINMTGLRGAREVEQSPRGHLVLAAVALGIGQAAADAALEELRRSHAAPAGDAEKPHWVVADVATEVEAARLLTYKAACSAADADIALARLMASSAAAHAVDAAVRVIGPAALAPAHQVERLARDIRAVSVLLGTEEDQRALAAEGLLPR